MNVRFLFFFLFQTFAYILCSIRDESREIATGFQFSNGTRSTQYIVLEPPGTMQNPLERVPKGCIVLGSLSNEIAFI